MIIAEVFASLDERDRAFTWLERALEDRRPTFVHLNLDPAFDLLRGDPRFAELAARVGLGGGPAPVTSGAFI